MTDTIEAVGRCLCGEVETVAKQLETHISSCHCSMCRKWGGGPLLAADCGTQVEFTGAEHIGTFSSSDWAERGFCRNCGTHLFYRLKESGQYIMPAGLFDSDPPFELQGQIFVDEKPGYYNFAEQTQMMTGAEVFALYAPPETE